MKQSSRYGFTLIELLVVVAIIGILAAIIYPNFNDARADARNKAMLAEFRETQLALEVYKAQNGDYPSLLSWPGALTPEFIAEVPQASDAATTNSGTPCSVTYWSDSNSYKLTGVNCYGNASDATEGIQPTSEFARCPDYCASCGTNTMDAGFISSAAFYESFSVYSTGGECR